MKKKIDKMLNYKIRLVENKDIKDILDLEDTIYSENAFDKKIINKYRSSIKHHIWVAENVYRELIGYVIFCQGKRTIFVERLVVDPSNTGDKVGTKLLDKVIDKLGGTIKKIQTEVSENSLVSHLFLQNNGFVATEILYGGDENYYVFEYGKNIEQKIKN